MAGIYDLFTFRQLPISDQLLIPSNISEDHMAMIAIALLCFFIVAYTRWQSSKTNAPALDQLAQEQLAMLLREKNEREKKLEEDVRSLMTTNEAFRNELFDLKAKVSAYEQKISIYEIKFKKLKVAVAKRLGEEEAMELLAQIDIVGYLDAMQAKKEVEDFISRGSIIAAIDAALKSPDIAKDFSTELMELRSRAYKVEKDALANKIDAETARRAISNITVALLEYIKED